MLIGRQLVKVVRLAWRQAGEPDDLTVGLVHLVFDDGRGLLLAGRSDWTLKIVETHPGDDSWLTDYDYDYDGGRWLSRDASNELPFASVIGGSLVGLASIPNECDEVVGLMLEFVGQTLALRMWQGEVTA